jgi:hypothetical protein
MERKAAIGGFCAPKEFLKCMKRIPEWQHYTGSNDKLVGRSKASRVAKRVKPRKGHRNPDEEALLSGEG